jgi:hypothetical protein
MTTSIVASLLSAAAAFIGAWLVARFALNRFKQEKIWERQAAAYTAIFDAMNDVDDVLDKLADPNLPHDEREKVEAKIDGAIKAVFQKIESASLVVPDAFIRRIIQHTNDMHKLDGSIQNDAALLEAWRTDLHATMRDLRQIARGNLRV